MPRRKHFSIEPPWPQWAFMHHLGLRYLLTGLRAEALAEAHFRFARRSRFGPSWLGQSFTVRRRGRTSVAYGTARYAREALGLAGVGRIQLSWGDRQPTYLVVRAAIDPRLVAEAFLRHAAQQATITVRNVCHLELAVEVLLPPDASHALRMPGRCKVRPKARKGVTVHEAWNSRLFTPNGGRVDAVGRLYARDCDSEAALARIEVATGRITRHGHHEDLLLPPRSRTSCTDMLVALGWELTEAVQASGLQTVRKPSFFRGLAPIWHNDTNAPPPPEGPGYLGWREPRTERSGTGGLADQDQQDQGFFVTPGDADWLVLERMDACRRRQAALSMRPLELPRPSDTQEDAPDDEPLWFFADQEDPEPSDDWTPDAWEPPPDDEDWTQPV